MGKLGSSSLIEILLPQQLLLRTWMEACHAGGFVVVYDQLSLAPLLLLEEKKKERVLFVLGNKLFS